jgi:hypothetical protein
VIQIMHARPLVLNQDRRRRWINETRGKKNRAEDLPGSFAGSLREIAEGDVSASSFLLLPSACVPCCIPFLCLYFSLFFFVFMLCFQNTVSLSLGQFSLSFFLSQNWWGKPISGMGVLEMNLKIVCFACVSLLFGFFRLSLSLTNPCSSVLLGLYRARRVDNGR